MRRKRLLLSSVLGGAALCLEGCSGGKPIDRPNVVLISIDTLRADHLPTYGYGRPTAPQIDEFAREASVFDRCCAEASRTLPSHATLLTGLYPETHGMLSGRSVMAEELSTFAEVLHDSGYRTGAFVNCSFFDPKFKLDQGFGTYDFFHEQQKTLDGQPLGRSAERTNRDVFRWLDEAPDEPFFLFVHYYDVHSDWRRSPYESPPEHRRRFEIEKPPGFEFGDGEVFASLYLRRRNERGMSYGRAETAYLRSLYDGGIAYTDEQSGALLRRLREMELMDRSIVILLSDHGEEFQDHGKLLHLQVYEELVRVPLAIRFPPDDRPASPARVPSLVQLGDIMPTVLDYLGIEPPENLQGESFLPLLAGNGPGRQYAYARNHDGSQYAIRDERWKLILHDTEQLELELFDLDADPGETANLAGRQDERVHALFSELTRWRQEAFAERPERMEESDLDEETLKRLEALGYVGN